MNRPLRQPACWSEVLLVVAVKLLIILALWWCFFSPEHRPKVTSSGMNDVLFGTGSTPSPASAEATTTGSPQ